MVLGKGRQSRKAKRHCVAASFLLSLSLGVVGVVYGAGHLAGLTHQSANLTHKTPNSTVVIVKANATAAPEVRIADLSLENHTVKDEGIAVAVVITLTKEPPRGGGGYLDGAAVLAHSIRSHIRGPKYSKVHAIALCGTDATVWSNETWARLDSAGWEARSVDVPISLDEIEGDFYRKVLPKSGCCGEKELIKLHAFTLEGYDRVLLLDADSLLLQPIDELLEVKTDAVWTFDTYLGGKRCINGGFFVLTPSREVFSRMIDIARKGDFRNQTGWSGTSIGWCFGGQTFQGIVPYYYQQIHPAPIVPGNEKWRAVDNCIYNNFGMGKCKPGVSSSFFRKGGTKDKTGLQIDTPIQKIKTAHFTGPCKKPFSDDGCKDRTPFCVRLMDAWWDVRYSLEQQSEVERTIRCENGRYYPLNISFATISMVDHKPTITNLGAKIHKKAVNSRITSARIMGSVHK